MNTNKNLDGLIDSRNFELWDFLSNTQEIEICTENRPDYLSFSKDNKTIIYVPHNNLVPAFFTHELLHIYLRTKEVFISGALTRLTRHNTRLSQIFSCDLIDHIGNYLDHIKMLPMFLKLGYDEKDFISDYSINKLTNDDIVIIQKNFKRKIIFKTVYNAIIIESFIAKYFAANSCPNKSFDYQTRLNDLEKIDPDLFQILDSFLNDWKNFDYNDIDPITGGYRMLAFNFVENLKKWTDGKIIK